jgi:hypothetical protein
MCSRPKIPYPYKLSHCALLKKKKKKGVVYIRKPQCGRIYFWVWAEDAGGLTYERWVNIFMAEKHGVIFQPWWMTLPTSQPKAQPKNLFSDQKPFQVETFQKSHGLTPECS